MNPNNEAMPPPTASLPLDCRCASLMQRWCPPGAKSTESNEGFPLWKCLISIAEVDCDPVNIAEIFKEEISYRAQARRFLWEYFD